MLTAIVGVNWGDEGKGKMVDLFSKDNDIVVRYQGGNNAGHTVINDKGKFILNLLPSGVLRDGTVNVMGPGMVIDIEHLHNEVKNLREKGVGISPENLKISDKAVICMPYHKLLDCLEEDRLGDAKFGSTRRGIAPVYSDKYMKKAVRMGDLLYPSELKNKLSSIVDWKNLAVRDGYKQEPLNAEDMYDRLMEYGSEFTPYIADVGVYLNKMNDSGKNIMFEAQLGALRDIDFGIYPYTSSSSVIAAYAPIGAGVPNLKLDRVIGVMKAFSTCVGEGPFTCEMFGEEADKLRELGGEYGAATGRPRRVGGFDVVASKYGVLVQGADSIALTKLDVLSSYDKIPVCEYYDIDGEITDNFPVGVKLDRAKPIYKYMDGWKTDISSCRKKEELPENAIKYVKYIEEKVNCPIDYVAVGPERDAVIFMR